MSKLSPHIHRRSKGGGKGAMPPKFLENIVILCFERRFSKQNSVIPLKSHTLTPPKFLGWLRHCSYTITGKLFALICLAPRLTAMRRSDFLWYLSHHKLFFSCHVVIHSLWADLSLPFAGKLRCPSYCLCMSYFRFDHMPRDTFWRITQKRLVLQQLKKRIMTSSDFSIKRICSSRANRLSQNTQNLNKIVYQFVTIKIL